MIDPSPTIAKVQLGWVAPALVGFVTLGFALMWRFVPIGLNALLVGYVVLTGLIVGNTVVARLHEATIWTHSEFAKVQRRAAPPSYLRAKDLVEFESMIMSTMRYEHDLYLKVRPTVRYIANIRLAERGIELDDDPLAREVLGEDLYELVHGHGARPGVLFAPGVSLESLTALVERLEQL
jgi:hypothetical protein